MESIEILLRDIQGENRNIMRTLVENVKGIRSGSLLVLTLNLMNPHSVERCSIFCIDQHTQIRSSQCHLLCAVLEICRSILNYWYPPTLYLTLNTSPLL